MVWGHATVIVKCLYIANAKMDMITDVVQLTESEDVIIEIKLFFLLFSIILRFYKNSSLYALRHDEQEHGLAIIFI